MNTLADSLARAQAREEFKGLAVDIKDRQPVDLLDTALLIAKHQYPNLVRTHHISLHSFPVVVTLSGYLV